MDSILNSAHRHPDYIQTHVLRRPRCFSSVVCLSECQWNGLHFEQTPRLHTDPTLPTPKALHTDSVPSEFSGLFV